MWWTEERQKIPPQENSDDKNISSDEKEGYKWNPPHVVPGI